MFTKLTEFLDDFIKAGIPGYDCIVLHKGQCVYRRCNGYSDVENIIPMNGQERYNIYSCSKPITCAAALQLYEKGLFQLDDKLSKYMQEFETMYVKAETGVRLASKPITIRDLFCMTAGFSYDLHSPMLEQARIESDNRCSTRATMKYLAKEPLLFEPGTRWEYSLCHDVLAALVEVLSGMPFEEYVKENIFEPLGMLNSTFVLPIEEVDTICAHYEYNHEEKKLEKRSKIPDYRLGTEYASGGAGCVSTVEDYIKFLEAMRIGDIILKKETIDLMCTSQLPDEKLKKYWFSTYGYGLGVRCSRGYDGLTDFGWGGAAGAYLIIDRENEFTAFYVQHVLKSPIHNIRTRICQIVQECLKGTV
ncbi:MAG: beta-lactamase family protein [Lachnospiraceae bacterium]|nr:beta-lactamase family protein [Lachnospiraceae bacterium]